MAPDRGITAWITRLHPLLALLAIIGGILLGRIAGLAVAVLFAADAFAPAAVPSAIVGAAVVAVFVIGYPVAVAVHLHRTYGPTIKIRPARIARALLVMIPAFVIAAYGFLELGPGGPGTAILQLAAILVWLAGLVVILWTTSRGLVLAERGRIETIRVIGTFLLFWFLPLGVYLLQHRVRCLSLSGAAPQAA